MVETRSGKMQDPAQERIKFEEPAKKQPGATICIILCTMNMAPLPALQSLVENHQVRSEDPSVYAVKGRGLAFLIKNLYYEDIAVNITNTLDLEAQGIKVYLNQNEAINI
ncbi:hypothetical protein LAZ67_17002312 [Cordylochernes scorpioides]|uniref:Uncharacterized protein n=1 Tax=Cordylochernes scorpioides TaxID=51811 RepID=A0ABY6LHM4_9ARAC|nr:hypothetical protein LAZ67_17002312 [Cordylochernes scorpioides]